MNHYDLVPPTAAVKNRAKSLGLFAFRLRLQQQLLLQLVDFLRAEKQTGDRNDHCPGVNDG